MPNLWGKIVKQGNNNLDGPDHSRLLRPELKIWRNQSHQVFPQKPNKEEKTQEKEIPHPRRSRG